VPLTASQLSTDMDLVSASLEAHDVNPSVLLASTTTLKTATLRLLAALVPWAKKGGLAQIHQFDTREVQLSADDYNGPDFTYTNNSYS
jgi:hypothetical protein